MILLAEFGLLTGLCLGAMALVIGWLLLRTHRVLGRQRRDNSPMVRLARPEKSQSGHHLDAPAEVLRWEVQMHETARALAAQLDSKMGVLEALIAEADRAANRLEAAAGGSPQSPPPTVPPDPQPTTQAEALRGPGPPEEPANRLGQPFERPSSRPAREEVYALADRGLRAAEIARRLGSPVGEIDLILGLRQKG